MSLIDPSMADTHKAYEFIYKLKNGQHFKELSAEDAKLIYEKLALLDHIEFDGGQFSGVTSYRYLLDGLIYLVCYEGAEDSPSVIYQIEEMEGPEARCARLDAEVLRAGVNLDGVDKSGSSRYL